MVSPAAQPLGTSAFRLWKRLLTVGENESVTIDPLGVSGVHVHESAHVQESISDKAELKSAESPKR